MATVLLVGPWAPSALAFARSAKRQGIGVYLLQATAQHHTRWSFSALRGATTIPATLVGTREGLDRIKQYAGDIGAAALVATVDRELVWLGEHRHEFEPSCRVLVQPPASLVRLLSKRHQLDLARRAGLSVLPTYFLVQAGDADSIPATYFPLALRPDRPEDVQPEFKIQLVRSRDELQAVIRGCERLGSPIIAQPFRHLPNLLVHGVRSATGEVIGSRCYAVPRKFEGLALAVEPRAFPPQLEEQCREFARLAEIAGCYHLEFLFSPAEKRAYFLEVNVRLGGTTDKVVQTGFDEPALLLQAYAFIPPHAVTGGDGPRRVVNKRVLLKHIVWAARGKLTALDYPDVSRVTHIAYSCRNLLVANDSIFDWRDVPGSLRFHLRT